MLLPLMQRFHPYVLDGSKRHTVRAKRKNPPRVGQSCDLYGDSRQKTMFLVARFPCIEIESFGMTIHGSIVIEGTYLDSIERNTFAWADGFRADGRPKEHRDNFAMMFEFWRDRLKEIPLSQLWWGDVIHWRYDPAGRAVQFGGKAK